MISGELDRSGEAQDMNPCPHGLLVSKLPQLAVSLPSLAINLHIFETPRMRSVFYQFSHSLLMRTNTLPHAALCKSSIKKKSPGGRHCAFSHHLGHQHRTLQCPLDQELTSDPSSQLTSLAEQQQTDCQGPCHLPVDQNGVPGSWWQPGPAWLAQA